jgi:hypothetical protein
MSTAQYRRIIKGNWSNTNEQKREDSIECQEEDDSKTEENQVGDG